MRALSNLTPNCGAHAHSPQPPAAECACWGRGQPGHGEGNVEQPFAYIKAAAPPMASCFQLRGAMGPEKEPGLWIQGHSPVLMSPCDQNCWVGLG